VWSVPCVEILSIARADCLCRRTTGRAPGIRGELSRSRPFQGSGRNRSIASGRLQERNHLGTLLGRCEPAIRLHVVAGHNLIGFRDEAIELLRDSCSSTRLGTHRYSGDDSQSGCSTQANTYSDRTRSQGASSDPGEGSLAQRLEESPEGVGWSGLTRGMAIDRRTEKARGRLWSAGAQSAAERTCV
jgi:hypothetical protein